MDRAPGAGVASAESRAYLLIIEQIRRFGPLRFDAFVEAALYGPGGFYASGQGAGRRGDFLTSPVVGPLFGAVVARALDTEWDRLGRPDPFVVVEAGAGRGALASAVLGAAPACREALRYVCVERSVALRAEAEALLPVEPATAVLGPVVSRGADEDPRADTGNGPLVCVLDDLPAVPVTGVVLANELLDNLAFRLLQRCSAAGWAEVLVGATNSAERGQRGAAGDRGGLVEILVDAPPDDVADAEGLAPAAPTGARIPLQQAATDWLRRALAVLCRGRVVVIDYAATTPSLAARPWGDWARTYRSHGQGGDPLDAPGTQDITCEVAVDQLQRVRLPDGDRSQAEWLGHHGIEELVEAARVTWQERAHLGDLAALAARSRVGEADALLDPAGFGAFRVLEWEVGG